MKKPVTFTIEESTIELLREVSKDSMIPQARIVEQAILEYIERMKSSK